jgi:hypothetical protein
MPPLTRAAKRVRTSHVRDHSMGIVLSSGLLHWYKAVKVGKTCKEMQHDWEEKKNLICEAVLAALTELKINANICKACKKVAVPASQLECVCSAQEEDIPLAHLDPRFNESSYAQLSTWNHGRIYRLARFEFSLEFPRVWKFHGLGRPSTRVSF